MASLTSQQTNELAGNFLALAKVIGEYRYENFDTLSKQENEKMKDMHLSILAFVDDLYTLSATLVMDDVQSSLATINKVTIEMEATYETIQDVQKAINVAASVVTLGASVLSKDPQTIAESIGGLVDTWRS